MLRTGHLDLFARDHLPRKELLRDRMIEKRKGERIALRTDDAVCTYRQLQAQVNRIAHVLRNDMSLVPGHRVLLRGANNPMMAACFLAVIKAGLVAVPTMPLLRARELHP